MAVQHFGRTRAVELLREGMLRPEGAGDVGRRPVLLFEGGPGSGKTAVLDSLESLLKGRAPYAYLDLEAVQNELDYSAIPELLAALAFQLARHCEPYGTLQFPRLVLGHLVMDLTLDWVNPRVAGRQVTDTLKAHRGVDAVTSALKDAAGALIPKQVPVPRAVIDGPIEWAVHKIITASPLGRPILGRYQEWYGHQDQQDIHLHVKPIEALVTLNRWAKGPTNPAHEKRLNNVLWNAFLADLRDSFRNGRRCDEWPFNAVVLLDNVDTELGRKFLVELIQAHGLSSRDPLTIVAASGGGLAATLDDTARSTIHDVDEKPPGTNPGPSWLRYRLRDLTPDEVRSMVTDMGFSAGTTDVLAANLYQFTGGNPAATRLLLDAVPADSAIPVELETLLRSRRSGRTVEDELLRTLLGRVRSDVVGQLEICSAARNITDGQLLANCEDLVGLNGVAEFPAGLWLPDSDAEPTLLRRLLLRRLAARPDTWAKAHEPPQQRSVRRDDLASKLYYILAIGAADEISPALTERLKDVSRALTERLKNTAVPDWLKLVRAVCWAPRRNADQVSPEEATRKLLDGVDAADQPFASVIAVVARLSIASDPLCGSDRVALYWQLAGALRALSTSEHVDDTSGELFAAIQRYEELARSVAQAFKSAHEKI